MTDRVPGSVDERPDLTGHRSMAHAVGAGVLSALTGQLSTRAIGFIRGIVLARLLAPDDFGLFALAGTVVGLFAMVSDGGAGAFVVQRPGDRERLAHGAFSYGVMCASVVAVSMAASGPVFGQFYGHWQVRWMIALLAVGLFLEGSSTVPLALLRRGLQFRVIAMIGAVASLVSLASAILLAWLGSGAWSLGYAAVAASAAQAALVWWSAGWRPRLALGLGKQLWPDVWRFGSLYFASDLAWYGLISVDSAVVGKLLGAEALGVYSLAMTYALLLPGTLGAAVNDVMFPTLASVQNDAARLRAAYLKTGRLMLAVGLPTTLGAVFIAPSVFAVAFGQKWHAAVLPFQILLFLGLGRALLVDVFRAVGRPDIDLKLTLGALFALSIALAAAVPFALLGVAVAASTTAAGLVVASLLIAGRLLQTEPLDMMRNLAPYAVCCGIAAALAALVTRLIPDGLPHDVGGAVVVIGLYCWLLGWRFRSRFDELRALFVLGGRRLWRLGLQPLG